MMSEIDRAMDILEQDPDVKKYADSQRRPKQATRKPKIIVTKDWACIDNFTLGNARLSIRSIMSLGYCFVEAKKILNKIDYMKKECFKPKQATSYHGEPCGATWKQFNGKERKSY